MVALLSMIRGQNSDFLAVGCGLNDCFRRTRTQRSGTRTRIEATATGSIFGCDRLGVYRTQIQEGADVRVVEHDTRAE